jgi:hypothetical protein
MKHSFGKKKEVIALVPFSFEEQVLSLGHIHMEELHKCSAEQRSCIEQKGAAPGSPQMEFKIEQN